VTAAFEAAIDGKGARSASLTQASGSSGQDSPLSVEDSELLADGVCVAEAETARETSGAQAAEWVGRRATLCYNL